MAFWSRRQSASNRSSKWPRLPNAPEASQLRRRSDEQPGNPLLRLELAEALAAEGQLEEALDLCVLTVSTGTPELKSRAKDALLDILNLPGVDGDLASDYRRKLASALY